MVKSKDTSLLVYCLWIVSHHVSNPEETLNRNWRNTVMKNISHYMTSLAAGCGYDLTWRPPFLGRCWQNTMNCSWRGTWPDLKIIPGPILMAGPYSSRMAKWIWPGIVGGQMDLARHRGWPNGFGRASWGFWKPRHTWPNPFGQQSLSASKFPSEKVMGFLETPSQFQWFAKIQ